MDQNKPTEPSTGDLPPAAASAKPVRLASLRRDPKGWLILLLGLGAPLAFVVAAAGGGIGLWGWQAGLGAIPWILLAALLTLILAIIFIVLDRRKARKTRWPLLGIGIVGTLGFLGFMIPYATAILTLPAIHDITTDMTNPPAFTALAAAREAAPNAVAYPGAETAQQQQAAYPMLQPVTLAAPIEDVSTAVRNLIISRGWELAADNPTSFEATATTRWFGFKDDVAIRLIDTSDGVRIDMRSASRLGKSDLGTNAERIQAFLEDLQNNVQ